MKGLGMGVHIPVEAEVCTDQARQVPAIFVQLHRAACAFQPLSDCNTPLPGASFLQPLSWSAPPLAVGALPPAWPCLLLLASAVLPIVAAVCVLHPVTNLEQRLLAQQSAAGSKKREKKERCTV